MSGEPGETENEETFGYSTLSTCASAASGISKVLKSGSYVAVNIAVEQSKMTRGRTQSRSNKRGTRKKREPCKEFLRVVVAQ